MKCLCILALVLAACAPTTPSEDMIGFTFEPTATERAFAESEFDTQRTCVGAEGRTAQVSIVVHDGFFNCGGIAANGCLQTLGSIHVNRHVFDAALSHEYIHMWEAKLGHAPDYEHTGAVWGRCDRLNGGGAR